VVTLLLARDARIWLRAFNDQASSHYVDSVGVIAAWAADEYLLGRRSFALAFLRKQAAAGHLNSLLNSTEKGTAFISALTKFLRQRAY
jgi:hypothetical protein